MMTRTSALAAASLFLATLLATAQSPRRISQALSAAGPRAALAGTVSPRARLAADLGPLPGDTPVQSVSLHFSLTDAQNAALTQLLDDQQNPASARCHQWLTPEGYAVQFGLADADLAGVTEYFAGQGLTVTAVARSHSFIAFSGTASQIDRALGTTLHAVSAEGERHFANLSEPQLPAALAAVTRSIIGLNDFRLRPRVRMREVARPAYTASTGAHYLAPGDLYTIYNLKPLLASSIDGSGVTIAVLGQTDIPLASAAAFRAASGLPANAPVVKLYGADPGTSAADLPEAMLDVGWAGAMAPSATILYVNSTDVIAGSLTQAVDNNLAPIVSMSYGACELDFGAANLATYNQLFRQANAQGQTIVGPSGDDGATDCDYGNRIATGGLAVDFPASSPNVTGVGGTMFNEGAGSYFTASNGAYSGSAISYIPETVWNETAMYGSLAGGGGGVSAFFSKPSYQTGNGVPNDFARDVPDLSLAGAVLHDGYLLCTPGYCANGYASTGGNVAVIGGTSVGTPEFAGMLALLEQKIQQRVGNANPVLYGLANSTYSTAVFHDITAGNNAMPCAAGSTGCASGGSLGYNATAGYDLATGWGTVDAYNLVSDWLLVAPAGIATGPGNAASATTLTVSSATVASGGSITLTAKVASAAGGIAAVPTGTVQFLVDDAATGGAVGLANGSASYSLLSTGLSLGTHTVSASYSGDALFAGSKSSVLVGITPAVLPDFSLTPGTATVTTKSGTSAPGVTFTVVPLNGFSGKVSFVATTTSTTLNNTSTPSFNPISVTLNSTAAGSTVLTLSAFVMNGSSGIGPVKASAWGVGVAMAGFCCLLVSGWRRRFPGLVLLVVAAVSGCGGGVTAPTLAAPVNTPAGTYLMLVTATGTSSTGAAMSHSSTITLVVQ